MDEATKTQLTNDILTILEQSPHVHTVKVPACSILPQMVGEDVTGVTVTDLMDALRHPWDCNTGKWRGLPPGGYFESLLEDLGFKVVNTGIRKGGGFKTMVTI